MTRGALPIGAAIAYAKQLLEALRFAHRHGIIHRDIKPHNVLVSADQQKANEPRLKVTGLRHRAPRRLADDRGRARSWAPAQYLSPEQARGAPVTAASDLYSAGVVLYEMLTGKVPFTGDSAIEIAMKHVNELPAPPSALRPRSRRSSTRSSSARSPRTRRTATRPPRSSSRTSSASRPACRSRARPRPRRPRSSRARLGRGDGAPLREPDAVVAPPPPPPPRRAAARPTTRRRARTTSRREAARRWVPWLLVALLIAPRRSPAGGPTTRSRTSSTRARRSASRSS